MKQKRNMSMKGVECKKCGCRKFRPIGICIENVECVHCGTFTIIFGGV